MARLAIRMPKMSMTMTEGEVSSWMVDIGAEIAEGDVICEVMTDKVDMEVESTVSGKLVEIVVPSGTVEVGAQIGWVFATPAVACLAAPTRSGAPRGSRTSPPTATWRARRTRCARG